MRIKMNMNKWIVTLAAFALMLSLAACGAKEAPKAAEQPPASTGASSSSSSAQQVKLVATNFQFEQKEYKVKQGQDVTFTLENKEGMHGISINGLNVKLDNGSKTATVKADKAGTYDIICTVPCGQGHISMKSKLIVE